MHRNVVAMMLLIAGTVVPAIAASGDAAALDLLTTTTTSTTSTTAPGGTATEDETTTTSTTAPEETASLVGEDDGLLDSGALSISVPAAAALSAGTPVGTGGLTGALGAVTVTDTRTGLVPGWTAYASATDFVTGGGTVHETTPRANIAYWSGPATATAGVGVFGPGQPTAAGAQPLGLPVMAFSALTTTGDTSATWVPTLVVTLPTSAVVGQYTGTITHSVA